MIELDRIQIHGGTQARVELDQAVVAEYAEAYRAGVQMPPIRLFFDGSDWWLADGFHRYFGAKAAGLSKIYEEITPGTQRDAVLYSLRANATHGLKRTIQDKRKAVETLLADSEWSTWSDRKLAELCAVSVTFVGSVRRPEVAEQRQLNRVASAARTVAGCSPATPPAAPAASLEAAAPPPVGTTDAVAEPPTAAPAAPPPAGPKPEPAAPALARVEALQEEIHALREQLDAATAQLATLDKVLDADDQLAAAVADAQTQRTLAQALQARLDSMMTEIADLKREVRRWKHKAEKAGAA